MIEFSSIQETFASNSILSKKEMGEKNAHIDEKMQELSQKIDEKNSLEKVLDMIQNGSLDLSEKQNNEIKEIGDLLVQNPEKFAHMKALIIPDKVMYFGTDKTVGIIILRIGNVYEKITIKTKSGIKIPRAPKKLD